MGVSLPRLNYEKYSVICKGSGVQALKFSGGIPDASCQGTGPSMYIGLLMHVNCFELHLLLDKRNGHSKHGVL